MTAKQSFEEKKDLEQFTETFFKASEFILEDVASEAFLTEDQLLDLKRKLKSKSELGLQKYGEKSFQSSFENLINCPIDSHLEEEILDAINYSIALYIKKTYQTLKEPSTKLLRLALQFYKELV